MLEPQRPLGRDSRNFPTRGEEGGGASAAGEGRAGGRAGRSRPATGLSACGAALRGCSGGFPAVGRARPAPPTPTPARPGSRTMREADPPGRARRRSPQDLPGGSRPGGLAGGREREEGRSSPGKPLLAVPLEPRAGGLASGPPSEEPFPRRAWEGRAGARALPQSSHRSRASPRAKPALHLYPAEHGHLSTLGETGGLANFGGDFVASRAQVSLEPTELLPLAF